MKIRLTESQYNNLLKTINTNKKLTITESQYKRLILESADQFTGIETGNGIKIIAGKSTYTFKVFAVLNDELLVRNLNDGRYTTQYFLIKPGNLENNSLKTKKSKAIIYDYNSLEEFNRKEKDAQLKPFTFKNITSFEVYKDDKFKMLIEPKLDVETGERITPKSKHENDSNEFKDNLIRGIEPNHMYQLTFNDDSTVKFSVKQKSNAVIDIEFETVSEKTSMSSDEVSRSNKNNDKVWADWLKKQKLLIANLKKTIKNTDDPTEKDKLVKQLSKAEDDKEKNSKNINREEGLKSVSRIIYKGGNATKWMEALINSAEFKYKTGLKIDLNNTIVNKQRIKTLNKANDVEIAKLKKELASASTKEDKQRIQKELNDIDRILTLHFLNDKFDVYDNVAEGLRTFDLIVTLSYRPEEITKDLENGMEWDLNPKSEIYTKNFPLNGIKSLTIVKDKVVPSLTDKRDGDVMNMEPGEKLDLSRAHMDFKEINDYIVKSNADKTILSRPNRVFQLMGFKAKGMLPLEALQNELGNRLATKDARDKFIAGNLVLFEPDFTSANVVNNKAQLDIFESLVRGSTPKALVKRYAVGDNHVALNIRDGKVMYTLFIQTKDESVDEQLRENEYYVELKFNNNNNNEKKESIAKFKIKVIDYKATKLN